MSENDRQHYAKVKADPVAYAAYLERKRNETARRPERERKRKAAWRAKRADIAKRIRQAGHAVENAVRWGKLVKAEECETCGEIGRIEAHHHRGYERQYWLDVQWLCPRCHRKADSVTLSQERE